MATSSALLNVMIDAARKAAKGLVRDFGELEHLQVSKKGLADYVSAADMKAEKFLKEELTRVRPGYGFLGEEGGMMEGSDKTHTWIVDPLDGTTNFLHAIPHFAINIALEREDEIVAAVTFNPISDDLFWAEKGKGVYQNNRRLRVSQRKSLEDSLVATGVPWYGHGQHARFLKELHQVSARVSGIRRMGSAALDLANVAGGRYDAYWERDVKPWDIAAGILMVTEAGGKVTDLEGGNDMLRTGTICAGNLEVQPLLLEKIQAAQ